MRSNQACKARLAVATSTFRDLPELAASGAEPDALTNRLTDIVYPTV
jgi:hypothetical protein